MLIQMRDQYFLIYFPKAAWLKILRLFCQDAFGLLQGEGVFVGYGVVAGGLSGYVRRSSVWVACPSAHFPVAHAKLDGPSRAIYSITYRRI